MTKPIALVNLLLLATFTSAGLSCFSTSTHKDFYYYLAQPTAGVAAGRGLRIALGQFSTAPGYDNKRIAYRTRDYEISYYEYRRWVASPAKLLAKAMMRHLQASKLFSAVDMEDEVRAPDAVLEADVEAIEEVDRAGQILAHLAISFTLTDGADHVLLRHAFDEYAPAENRNTRAMVASLSAIVERRSKELAQRILEATRHMKKQDSQD